MWGLGSGSLILCALRLWAQPVTNTLKWLNMEYAEETMVCLACSGTPRLSTVQ